MTTWYTPEAVADQLDLHVETVRLQCRNGDWPGARKFGAKWRIPAEALEPTTDSPLITPPSKRSLAQQRKPR